MSSEHTSGHLAVECSSQKVNNEFQVQGTYFGVPRVSSKDPNHRVTTDHAIWEGPQNKNADSTHF